MDSGSAPLVHRRCTKLAGCRCAANGAPPGPPNRQLVVEPGFHSSRTLAKQVSPFINKGNPDTTPARQKVFTLLANCVFTLD